MNADVKAAAVRRTARELGLAPALTVLCGELPGVLPCGPRGHAVVPDLVAVTADRVQQDGRRHDRTLGEETVLLRTGSLVALRHRPRGPGEPAGRTGWDVGLLALRLGLSEGLLDACVRHLDGRPSGATTVLRQQLVKGGVAEVLIEHVEVHAVLTADAEHSAGDLAHLHAQVTAADRAVLRLFGASSFLTDGPGEVAYLSELLAEAYAEAYVETWPEVPS